MEDYPRDLAEFEARFATEVGDRRHDLSGQSVSRRVVGDHPEKRASALGLQRVLGLRIYKTAWSWLREFRRAKVRPGRDRLTDRVEVDETLLGGLEEGVGGVGKRRFLIPQYIVAT